MNNESIQIHINSKYATRFNNLHYSDVDISLPTIEVPSGYTIYLSVLDAVIPYNFKISIQRITHCFIVSIKKIL